MTHRRRRLTISGLILLSALLALAASPAAGQLNARPAGVTLIATLESVSLGAVPAPIHVRTFSSSPTGITQVFLITASWAVPAHLTTLRLLTCAASGSRDSTGLPVWSASATSNRADSHVEQIALPARSQQNSPAEIDTPEGPVRLMIEAL